MARSRVRRTVAVVGVVSAAAAVVLAGAGVAAHGYIRVVEWSLAGAAKGHGENHSDRYFWWNHSNGVSRLYNCHNT